MPRLPSFREAHPNIRFCINGIGDASARHDAPDIRVFYGGGQDEPLFSDLLLPVSGPDMLRRFRDMKPSPHMMEGMALLHIKAQLEGSDHPGWVEWFRQYGHRESGCDRGARFNDARLALEAVRRNVGFLVCGLSLVQGDLEAGRVCRLFPAEQHLVAPHPYRLRLRSDVQRRPQVQKFLSWLRAEAVEAERQIKLSS
jgi:LysR family glycine cleavage system transcriptional activator